jgi:signal transduction histidine kinase
MMSEKERLLNETHQQFMETGLNSPEKLDIMDHLASPDLMGFGTTIDERIFSVADLKNLITRQREQSQGIEIVWTINPVLRKVTHGGNVAVYVDEITLELSVNNENIKIALRYTNVLEYRDGKWVVIHFHGSKPENVATEEDTWGIEEWKTKNAALEKLVKERTAELEKSLIELKATQAQLIHSEKMASLGELTAGIAHEIQNPLNFVNNFSEVSNELLSEMVDEVNKGNTDEVKALAIDVQQNLEKILHHGKRADAIVKGMLQHSGSGTGKKEPTDINALADEYLRLAFHGLRAKDNSFTATIKTDFDPAIGNINLVQQDIGRVILNLISNAFYAVNERLRQTQPDNAYEPTVEVGTKKNGNKIEVVVKDNGNGIPGKVLDKIFQPFFTTKPTGQGTGLGLSLSYDIVKAHGGELSVETKENEGTVFTIYLPVI